MHRGLLKTNLLFYSYISQIILCGGIFNNGDNKLFLKCKPKSTTCFSSPYFIILLPKNRNPLSYGFWKLWAHKMLLFFVKTPFIFKNERKLMSFYGVYLHFFIFFARLKFSYLQNTKNDELHKKHPNRKFFF